MRRRDPAPEILRELDALEAALAGAPGADPELAALVADARAVRPQPTPAFTAALDAQASRAFAPAAAKPAAAAAGPARPRWRAIPAPALGIAAASLLALGVGAAVLAGGGRDAARPTEPATFGQGAVQDEAKSAGGGGSTAAAPAQGVVPPEPGPTDSAPQERTRRVERRATLALGVPRSRIDAAAADVMRITDAAGGIVASSTVADGASGAAGATFDLRIPAARLEATLARLSELGTVRTRTQSSLDITSSFVAPRDRLQEARAERQALLRALAKADTANETASIKARLRVAGQEIAAARSELRQLAQRANYSAVSLTLEARREAGGAGGPWTPKDALHDAAGILRYAAGVLLLVLAIGLPLAALAGLGYAGARALRRRRRHRALAGA
ncbi:MAG: DUF4349 domain-containing protein [Solirubrobacteraceae bacterium]